MTEAQLTKRRCETCVPGTPPIDEARAVDLQAQIDASWTRADNVCLRRSFKFRNFRDAFGFATRVALLAESEGHHPDFEIGWGRVTLELTTHVANGLTDNDFIVAAKVDKLYGSTGAKGDGG